MTALQLSALLLLVSGCAATSQQRPPFPVPDESRLSETERLGYRIYQLDQAAWIATDAARAAGAIHPPIQGWLAVPNDSSLLVRFIGPCGDGVCSRIDVPLTGGPPEVVRNEPPAPLSEVEEAMWRARQLAIATSFRACTPRYNTVVVPVEHDGAAAWRVYLLAASEDPDVVVLAGHHRITVSADGRSLLAEEPLSKSCLVQEQELGPDVTALIVTHVLDPEPIETHVFTSLNYRVPVYVGTERGNYLVEGASIRMMDSR
jgi:hypothetical protein